MAIARDDQLYMLSIIYQVQIVAHFGVYMVLNNNLTMRQW